MTVGDNNVVTSSVNTEVLCSEETDGLVCTKIDAVAAVDVVVPMVKTIVSPPGSDV